MHNALLLVLVYLRTSNHAKYHEESYLSLSNLFVATLLFLPFHLFRLHSVYHNYWRTPSSLFLRPDPAVEVSRNSRNKGLPTTVSFLQPCHPLWP